MKNPLKHHPKTADGVLITLGACLYYPDSHDGFAGPHPVEILSLSTTGLNTEVRFSDSEKCWLDGSKLFAKIPVKKN
jgi:hypothetical protein